MKAITCCLVLCAVLIGTTGTASARQDLSSSGRVSSLSCGGAISWSSARRYVGRYVTIKGPVMGATYASSSNGSPTFLNLGRDYPDAKRFTVVIWGRNRARFGAPENRYSGRTICVRGLVSTYRGIPQIEASSPSQIAAV